MVFNTLVLSSQLEVFLYELVCVLMWSLECSTLSKNKLFCVGAL